MEEKGIPNDNQTPGEGGATGNDSEKPLARVSKAYVCPIPTRLQSSHRDRVEN